MKKAIIGLVAMVLSLVGGGAVFAVETGHIVGHSEGGIEIIGNLGVDNTIENPIIPHGEGWINVDLNVTTMFYNVAGRTEIQSPSYGIRNNSARGVKVSVKSFENVTYPEETKKIKRLNLKIATGGDADINLIHEGEINTGLAGEDLLTIPPGNHDVDVTVPAAAWPTYNYVGEVMESLRAPSTPTYLLVLNFQALE